MTGKEVAEVLREVAQAYALKDDRRRAASFNKAVEAIERTQASKDLSGKTLTALKRIETVGASIATCIKQITETRTCDRLKELRAEGYPSVTSLMEVEGIGPATARDLWKAHGITSSEGLLEGLENGTLTDLKLLKRVKKALTNTSSTVPRKDMEDALAPIIEKLWDLEFIEDLEIAGSIRRKEDLVKDADILLKIDTSRTPSAAKRLATYCRGTFTRVNSAGKKKIQAVLLVNGEERNVDILIAKPEAWGSALNHFTGSKAHNIWCREQARKKGYTFNEYGVYRVKKQRRTSAYRDAESVEVRERVGGSNEMDLFEALGIGYVPPEGRVGGPYRKKDFVDTPVRQGRSGGDIPLADSVDMERFRLIMD